MDIVLICVFYAVHIISIFIITALVSSGAIKDTAPGVQIPSEIKKSGQITKNYVTYVTMR